MNHYFEPLYGCCNSQHGGQYELLKSDEILQQKIRVPHQYLLVCLLSFEMSFG